MQMVDAVLDLNCWSIAIGYLEPPVTGGEGGIRTPGTGLSQYDGLANRCFRPLSHLSRSGSLRLTVILLDHASAESKSA